jgi:hypothetical protein
MRAVYFPEALILTYRSIRRYYPEGLRDNVLIFTINSYVNCFLSIKTECKEETKNALHFLRYRSDITIQRLVETKINLKDDISYQILCRMYTK